MWDELDDFDQVTTSGRPAALTATDRRTNTPGRRAAALSTAADAYSQELKERVDNEY